MDLIQTGKIINTHGIKGEVKVESWAQTPEVLLQLKTFFIDHQKYTVRQARVHKGFVLILFDQVSDMNTAQTLKNKILYADKSDFSLQEDEYFIEDIIGLQVIDVDTHENYGQIEEVLITGANDVYDVVDDTGRHRLVPAIPDCIIKTDLPNQQMLIRPLKGLFDV